MYHTTYKKWYISNKISIDLSAYVLKTNFNNILDIQNATLNTKEQTLNFNSPLTRSSTSVSINLSAYPLKSNVDASFNTINTNK